MGIGVTKTFTFTAIGESISFRAYPMKVITETRRAHLILYLHFY